MSRATATPGGSATRTAGIGRTAVSRYDRAASLMVSLLILIGFAVAIMFLIWLTSKLVFRPQPVPVKLVENIAGRGDNPAGYERDIEAPGFEELPDLREPELEAALEAVTEATTAVTASLDVLDTLSVVTEQGEMGRGDSRPPGPEGEGDDIIPRWERWEIRWASSSVAAYARQLDFFGIELGVVGGKESTVDYASRLSTSRPSRRSGKSTDEKRLYMTWRAGGLIEFDRQLLARSRLASQNRIVMQFYPEPVEDRLAEIELAYANGRSVKEIAKTIFRVKSVRRGFEFEVVDQRYRVARN